MLKVTDLIQLFLKKKKNLKQDIKLLNRFFLQSKD